jgi:hypothetical protein
VQRWAVGKRPDQLIDGEDASWVHKRDPMRCSALWKRPGATRAATPALGDLPPSARPAGQSSASSRDDPLDQLRRRHGSQAFMF